MEEMVALDFLSFEEEEEKCLEFLVEELLDLTELTDHESPEAVDEEERIPTGVTCDSEDPMKESIDVSSTISFPDEDTAAELEWASRICDDSSTAAAGNEDGAFEPVKIKRRKRHGDGKLWFLSAPPRIDSPVSSLATSVSVPRSCGGKEKISSVFCFPDAYTIPTSIWASKICDDCSAIATGDDEDRANAPVKAKRRKRHGDGNHWSLSTPPPHESSPTSPSHTSHVADSCEPKEHKVRRCTHCSAQRTPQWREGPLGSKTLCNACGVRYKSGRLLPEYRPACSPTFVRSKHSNCHREVLEMRRKKLVEKPLSISTPWVFAC